MKLYRLDMDNGREYEDYKSSTMLIVAENEVKAKVRAEQELKKLYDNKEASYDLEEINVINGYEVIVREKRHYAQGSNYFN